MKVATMYVACRSSETRARRAFAAFANREVNRSGGAGRKRDDHRLAALAQDGQSAMSSFETERFDVRTGCFRNPQFIEWGEWESAGDLP
jgi:hypothetical protein